MRQLLRDDGGSSAVEFVLVGALLSVMTAVVLQVGVALYVRNMVLDASVEGAQRAALADATPSDGIAAAQTLLTRTIGATYAQDVSVTQTMRLGVPTVEITIRAPLPILGLFGVPEAMEVTGYAPLESFDVD